MGHRAVMAMTPTSRTNKRRACSARAAGAASAVAGFTLLELLIVISIIAIGTGLIIPNLALTDNAAFNADVRSAAATLTYARRTAIVKGAPQTATLFALNPQHSGYDELLEEVEAADGTPHWAAENIVLSYQDELEKSAEPVDKFEVTFFPQGGSTGGLLSFARNQRDALIRIDPITGRITTAYNGEELDEER
jgi:type II secretion system protein H